MPNGRQHSRLRTSAIVPRPVPCQPRRYIAGIGDTCTGANYGVAYLVAMMQSEGMDPAQVFLAALMARKKSVDAAMERGDSAVQQFYCGTAVLVTGGTGFLGKQLIEKLLRATKISKVFVLLRPKKGKGIEERLNTLLQEPVFDNIREQQPDFADKVIPVAGDVADLKLGISDQDWNSLADQVNIIFHMAATTRFDTSLRLATMINIRGTREALLLGKACKNLKSYVHISTAFSHACSNRVNMEVSEDFYQSPVEPEILIQLAESVEESRLDEITPGLVKNWVNNYSFSKAVAEEMVRTMSDDLPICVVRPAVVIHSAREPQPGWIDVSNVNGASGLGLSVGLGLMHTMLMNDKVSLDFIPVDYVNNATIAAGWATAKRRAAGDMNPKIYTLTTSTRNPGVWGKLSPIMRYETLAKYPSPMVVAYSLFWKTSNPVMFWIHTWLLHLIPAYFIDGVCLLIGKERRFVKLYSKIYKMMTALSFFTCNNFDFVDANTEALYDSLSEIDREIFDFDVNKIDWREYMILWAIGLRKYILKDGLTRTEYAKKKLFFLKIFTYAAFAFYFFMVYKLLSLLLMIF